MDELARIKRSIGAKLNRKIARESGNIGEDDGCGTERAGDEPRELANGTAAGDQHGLSRDATRAQHGMDRHRERLGQGGFGPAGSFGQRVAVGGGRDNVFGKSAIDVWVGAGRAIEPHIEAEIVAPLAAEFTGAARHGRIDGDALSHQRGINARTRFGDFSSDFVAQNEGAQRHKAAGAAMHEIMDIGATNARTANPDQHLASLGDGSGNVFGAQIALAMKDDGFHRGTFGG